MTVAAQQAWAAQAWYVYGVLPAGAPVPQAEAVLPGAGLESLAVGALSVLASRVPRALFEQTSEANRTADPAWMAARITAHHAVNAAACEQLPCLPLAFGVLFSSVDLLRAWLAPREAALQAALGKVAQRREWALSLQQDAAAHDAWLDRHDPSLRALAEAAAGAGEGTAFLMARRRDKFRAGARTAHLATTAADIGQRLAGAGIEVLAEPPRAGLPAWSLLADIASDLPARLGGLAGELTQTGLSLRLSGPWPAYAYARAALAEDAVHA